jgi:hypothetical protein
MTPILLDFARKSGFTLCKEESALREMLEQFAKFIIEHEAAKQPAPVLSAGPITPEMANWSEADKAELTAVMESHFATPPAAQRPWVGLTHEEHMEIMTGAMTTSSRMAAVEAKLKEKNT